MDNENNKEVKLEEWHTPTESQTKKSGFGDKLAKLIVKYSGGLIKNEKQANYVLLGIAIVIFLISFVIFYNTLKGPTSLPTPGV